MKAVLAGPPNSGKSTVFNAVSGYKSVVSNFSGTTVQYTKSRVRFGGKPIELVDLPGVYTLSSSHEIGRSILDYLMDRQVDVLVNILDASQLEKGLPLTFELLEYNLPVVIGLNMTDEARREGMVIQPDELRRYLDVPVIEMTAIKNRGIADLMKSVREAANQDQKNRRKLTFSVEVEEALSQLAAKVRKELDCDTFSSRFVAGKLLEDESYLLSRSGGMSTNGLSKATGKIQEQLSEQKNMPADTVMMMERQREAKKVAQKVIVRTELKPRLVDRLDKVLLHSFWGYVVLFGALVGLFYMAFGVGALIEEPLLEGYHELEKYILQQLTPNTLMYVFVQSGLSGVGAGIAIVLPYLVPLLFLLTILEDIGYLPRMAYLADSFMSKIGIQGSAIMPAIMGYGCSVPAVMATRILPSRRDKIIASVMATLIPCSARSVVIMGLVGYFLGVPAALAIYGINIFIIAVTSRILSLLMPGDMPGMLLEIPPLRRPSLISAMQKVWYRMREFITVAWPLLVAGSVILGIIEFYGLSQSINTFLYPLTFLLGIPTAVGITLVFGVLRKELSLIMLMQALGTYQLQTVLSSGQIMSFALFVTFYLPCLATFVVLQKELGFRWSLIISFITFLIALGMALSVRLFLSF